MERDKKNINTSSQKSLLIRLKPDNEGGFIGEFHALQVVSHVPPADELKKLKEVLNDGPERVFAMAEKALGHKMEIEKSNEKTEAYLAKTSIWFAFIIGCLGIVCSAHLILNGHSTVGTILGAGTLGAIIASFMRVVLAKKSNKLNSDEPESPEHTDSDESPPESLPE